MTIGPLVLVLLSSISGRKVFYRKVDQTINHTQLLGVSNAYIFMDPLSTNLLGNQDVTSKRSLLIPSRTCFYEMMVRNTDDDELVEN